MQLLYYFTTIGRFLNILKNCSILLHKCVILLRIFPTILYASPSSPNSALQMLPKLGHLHGFQQRKLVFNKCLSKGFHNSFAVCIEFHWNLGTASCWLFHCSTVAKYFSYLRNFNALWSPTMQVRGERQCHIQILLGSFHLNRLPYRIIQFSKFQFHAFDSNKQINWI